MQFPEKGESMDRHESLRPLSRHHMVALLLSLNLKRVNTAKEKFSAKEMQAQVKDFWLQGGQQHFREEEEILLVEFAKYADVNISAFQEMLIEHVQLRALMETIIEMEDVEVGLLHDLGNLLEIHVRKEERVIFPLIEKTLPADLLEELAQYLH